MVMTPKDTVMNENITLGPNIRTAMVAGSWKVTFATVYINIATDYSHRQFKSVSEIKNPPHPRTNIIRLE
jgi:hypothetical protein